MSTYAQQPALPMLRPTPAGPQPTPPLRAPPSHQFQHSPPPPPRMDPLDLLSRVALGQYPIPTEQERPAPPTWPQPPHQEVYPSHSPPRILQPSPTSSVHDTRYKPVEYAQPSPPMFTNPPTIPPPYPPMHRASPGPEVFVPDFSPVSSDDGMPSTSHQPREARQMSEVSGRAPKVMRTAKDSDVHKPRSQPSRFCHICSRTSKKVGLVACGNFTTGACRKVICQKCFTDHEWDWEKASEMGTKWVCTHCRQECPDRAQCAIYKRTNERRREQQQQQKSSKESSRSNSKLSKGGGRVGGRGDQVSMNGSGAK